MISDNETISIKATELFWQGRKRLYLFSPLLVILFSYMIFEYIRNQFLISVNFLLTALVYFSLLFFLIQKNKKDKQDIQNVLLQDINIDLFEAYVEYAAKRSKKGDKSLKFDKGLLSFCKGEFETAKRQFAAAVIPPIPISKVSKDLQKLTIQFFEILSQIHLGSDETYEQIETIRQIKINNKKLESLQNNLYSYLKNINNILNESAVNSEYIELHFSNQHLFMIIDSFYRGLYYLKLGHDEDAKSCFEKLSKEDGRLYFANEAKKHLEELQ